MRPADNLVQGLIWRFARSALELRPKSGFMFLGSVKPGPHEARRILRRLEFHLTPKHGSWLNMAEIEIGVLTSQCLRRRIPSLAKLTSEVAAWTTVRNASNARIDWSFTVRHARQKLEKAYPRQGAKATCDAA